jgi:hypothetical protein
LAKIIKIKKQYQKKSDTVLTLRYPVSYSYGVRRLEMDEIKKPTPPYVPYKTLKNFLEKFKQTVPGRIDRDLMGSMSGAAQSQVTSALKYLKFISENNIPSDAMKSFVVLEGEERKRALEAVLTTSYKFIFADGFNLRTATASMLREAFEKNTGASGETVDRCIAFFKDAAAEAGIEVSKFILQKKPRTPASRKKGTRKAEKLAEIQGAHAAPVAHHAQDHKPPEIAAQGSLLLWGLFQRLPKPNTAWPKHERDQWVETLKNVLAMEY